MAGPDEPASPVLALREAFGDRKLPDISRKITACVACRKQKIKCHMKDSQPPCTRCKKRGLSCTVNRSLQMLLENDTLWKYTMEKKMQKLESIVSRLATDALPPDELQLLQEQGGHDASPSSHDMPDQQQQQQQASQQRSTAPPQAENQGPNHWEIVMDLDSGPGAIPGFYISDTPPARGEERHADFIARGVISLARAQTHFDRYKDRLDHFPYRILGDHEGVTLASVRASSPLLAAAVCAVGALHETMAVAAPHPNDPNDPNDPDHPDHPNHPDAGTPRTASSGDFDALYQEFVALLAPRALAKACSVEDVRALCIGAFWLGGDLSWTLVGTAVRMATELQLHKSFARARHAGAAGAAAAATAADRQHYVRARLWFLVYACDHHFSIVYGRPPLTRECAAIRGARDFLAGAHATEDDARLVSQVLRWSLCTGIFDTLGVDVDRPLATREQVAHVRRFDAALDRLRAEWADQFCPNAHVGNYPRKGVTLQYHFAKLYLCSHAFRGLGTTTPGSDRRGGGRGDPPPERDRAGSSSDPGLSRALDEVAHKGVCAARSILQAVVADREIQSYLNGLPVYFDVMIAFAAVFLLKVSTTFAAAVPTIDVQDIPQLLATLVATLQTITRSMHPRHLLVSITRGIERLLQQHAGLAGDGDGDGDEAAAAAAGAAVAESSVAAEATAAGGAGHEAHHVADPEPAAWPEALGWPAPGTTGPSAFLDPYFMGEYDFLTSQDMGLDLPFPLESRSW